MLEGMVELNEFLVDDQVTKTNKLKEITKMILNLDELDNSDNLKDGRPSNSLLTYHMTSNEDFMSFGPHNTRNLGIEPDNNLYHLIEKMLTGSITLFLIDDIIFR